MSMAEQFDIAVTLDLYSGGAGFENRPGHRLC
jgi:hypothetical protein